MSHNKMIDLLNKIEEKTAETYGVNGILARLFRKFLHENAVTTSRWNSYMARWLEDARNGIPSNKHDRTSVRGNITKEFVKNQMTWKVFCKSMRFFQIWRMEIKITCTHQDGHKSVHRTEVDFGTPRNPNQALIDDVNSDDINDEFGTEDTKEGRTLH